LIFLSGPITNTLRTVWLSAGVRVLASPDVLAGDHDLALKTTALLPTIAWAPFFLALATPGTAVEDEPGHLPRVVGVPANLVPATLIPAISGLGYALHRHGR
jgi:hypothetical protein